VFDFNVRHSPNKLLVCCVNAATSVSTVIMLVS
jgi:hypothetical protein